MVVEWSLSSFCRRLDFHKWLFDQASTFELFVAVKEAQGYF
jgi:hypothetical protein